MSTPLQKRIEHELIRLFKDLPAGEKISIHRLSIHFTTFGLKMAKEIKDEVSSESFSGKEKGE